MQQNSSAFLYAVLPWTILVWCLISSSREAANGSSYEPHQSLLILSLSRVYHFYHLCRRYSDRILHLFICFCLFSFLRCFVLVPPSFVGGSRSMTRIWIMKIMSKIPQIRWWLVCDISLILYTLLRTCLLARLSRAVCIYTSVIP